MGIFKINNGRTSVRRLVSCRRNLLLSRTTLSEACSWSVSVHEAKLNFVSSYLKF